MELNCWHLNFVGYFVGAPSSSSVTVAVSPPRMSLVCFRQRSYQSSTSSVSSSSLFFSSE